MNGSSLRIGTRGSALALWQARWVEERLRGMYPALAVMVRVIRTKGDAVLDAPLSKIGDKGLFTREIEHALLRGEVDLAVHSLKDLPTVLPDGLILGAVCEREDVRDVFIPHPGNPVPRLMDQPPGVTIATGSLRRRSQLLHARPDFRIEEIRGNLHTRLQKLEDSDWAGMMLARAGVVRLGLAGRIGDTLDPLTILPAVGQGALGIEMRAGDAATAAFLAPLHHRDTAAATAAERSLLRRLEGGCQIPIGAYGRMVGDGETLALDAVVGSSDGVTIVRGGVTGPAEEGERLGLELAGRLIADGAGDILAAIRGSARRPGDKP